MNGQMEESVPHAQSPKALDPDNWGIFPLRKCLSVTRLLEAEMLAPEQVTATARAHPAAERHRTTAQLLGG